MLVVVGDERGGGCWWLWLWWGTVVDRAGVDAAVASEVVVVAIAGSGEGRRS